MAGSRVAGASAEEFARNRLAVVGLGRLVFFVIFCFIGPIFYHGGLTSDLTATNVPPSIGHPLGTDNQWRWGCVRAPGCVHGSRAPCFARPPAADGSPTVTVPDRG